MRPTLVATARSRRVTLLCVACLPWQASTDAQDQPAARFAASAEAVVVDVVVRDAKGVVVRGLPASAFRIFEDGKAQRIVSFAAPLAVREVQGPANDGAAATALTRMEPAQADVVALVFEQLGIAALQLAVRASRDMIERQGDSNFTALFTIDRALQVVTAYTTSRAALDQGLEVVARSAGLPRRRAGIVPGAEFGSAASGAPTPETKADVPSIRGLATIDALSAVVDSLRLLPGRKVVVLFSEGLALDPPEDEPVLRRADGPDPMNDSWLTDSRFQKFTALLERANAARVAFYTFDAAGLRTENPLASLAFGRAPYVGLQFLAEQTGGAFVENTNDLAPGVRRAREDQRQVYEIGYEPAKRADDSYRRIRVAVDCTGCTVMARPGYRAATRRGLGQVGAHDVAPLLFLERGDMVSELPAGIDVRIRTITAGQRLARIEAEVPLPHAAGALDAPRQGPALLTILTRIRSGQRVVAVLSQHFDTTAAAGAAARFTRELELPPGEYLVDVVAYRHDTQRGTTYSKALRVPPSASR